MNQNESKFQLKQLLVFNKLKTNSFLNHDRVSYNFGPSEDNDVTYVCEQLNR